MVTIALAVLAAPLDRESTTIYGAGTLGPRLLSEHGAIRSKRLTCLDGPACTSRAKGEAVPTNSLSAPTSALDRRRFLRAAGLLTLSSGGALLLPGCRGGEPDDAAAPSPAADDETATASGPDSMIFMTMLPIESLTFAPELYAFASGYFDDAGLDVRVETARGTAQAIQGMLSELALLSRVGDIELMRAIGDQGAEELVNLGTLVGDSTIRFVSSPQHPVRTAEDFRGKLIGIPAEGGGAHQVLDLVAESAGIDDIETQIVGLAPGTYDLVEDGRIAAYAVSLDTAVLLEQTRDAVVFAPGDAVFAGGQCYVGNRVALEQQDGAPRDLVERYLAVITQAVDEIIADQENGFADVLEVLRGDYQFGALENTDVATASLDAYVASWTLDSRSSPLETDEARWQHVYEELVELGLVPSGLQPGEWYTNDLIS